MINLADSQEIHGLAKVLESIGLTVPGELTELIDRASWTVDLPPAPDLTKVSTAKTEKEFSAALLDYARAKTEHAAVAAARDELIPIRATQAKSAVAQAKATALPAVIERFDTVAAQFTELADGLPSLSLASMSTKVAENFIRVRATADDLRMIHAAYQAVVGALGGDLYWHSFVELTDRDQFRAILRDNESTEMQPLAPYYAPVVNGGRLRLLSKADAKAAEQEFNANRGSEPAEPHPHAVALDPKISRYLQSQTRG